MAKTPINNSQIFLWKVIVTGYTEYFMVQGSTIYCKVLRFTGVYWGEVGTVGYWGVHHQLLILNHQQNIFFCCFIHEWKTRLECNPESCYVSSKYIFFKIKILLGLAFIFAESFLLSEKFHIVMFKDIYSI